MSGRIAARGDGASEFQAHHGTELEAMAGAGRHDPALGALLLDNEAFVARIGYVASVFDRLPLRVSTKDGPKATELLAETARQRFGLRPGQVLVAQRASSTPTIEVLSH